MREFNSSLISVYRVTDFIAID